MAAYRVPITVGHTTMRQKEWPSIAKSGFMDHR